MEELIQNEKPRLVSTGQGFSFLNTVEYKGRFLYSKYNPERAVDSVIEKTDILSGTLVLIFSPLLWYGLEKLLSRLPEDCGIIAIEADQELEKIAREKLNETGHSGKVKLFNLSKASVIEEEIKKLLSTGNIKRSIRIDFSAGVQFSRELYDYTALAIQDIIGTFWKNRITLVKFGRLFSKNLVANLKRLSSSFLLEDVANTVEKPILVLGAGEGLDTIDWNRTQAEAFCIIAVDAALKPLLDRGIIPDAVVGMESQQAIQKAYTGTEDQLKGAKTVFFADLSSRYQIIDHLKMPTVFFASQYAEGKFFKKLKDKELIKNFILPMGSVGLAAFYIALRLRKNESVEIFTAGLDFSYSIGFTHAKSTMAHKGRLATTTRTVPVENIDAAFGQGTEFITSKNNMKIVTTKLLSSYAQQFVNLFDNSKNVFDASPVGIDLGLARKTTEGIEGNQYSRGISLPNGTADRKQKTEAFIQEEIKALSALRSLLSEGEESQYYMGENLENQIKEILIEREYLYLHFPDGYKISMDVAFLKRVRAEIDYFLKLLK
ncbi:6-hydroxymethylpterin diphosphokinase MptE-like protein [Treponema sp.]|uniref:6-hydroxymethylpterin diphosphokinase MptE-like protein n=1 Tax=Treponema sp. TaxID=166 RepID=UPI00298E0CAB|nr:6-hydroxymethylpterin diphosphokinase MptE-like protein [Treponema sp.]MCQ2240539.1 DUF115 domain-containing protein [Treponema sp.]